MPPPGGWRGRSELLGKAGLAYFLGMMVSIFFARPGLLRDPAWLSQSGTVILVVR